MVGMAELRHPLVRMGWQFNRIVGACLFAPEIQKMASKDTIFDYHPQA